MEGKKPGKQFLQKKTNSPGKKCWDKNRRKKCQKTFLYSHKYHHQKMGGEYARNNIYRSTRIARAKNVWKKLFEKSAKKLFYIHTYIMPKKLGEKREIIFPETNK